MSSREFELFGIVEFSFHKCDEYFVNSRSIAQGNLATDGIWEKAGKEHLHEAEIWANQQVCEAFGPHRMVYSVERVPLQWVTVHGPARELAPRGGGSGLLQRIGQPGAQRTGWRAFWWPQLSRGP
jgi:hypothetical protein